MKIRNGFVSNSSSSSFAIYGTMISIDQLFEALVKNKVFTQEEVDACIEEQGEVEEIRYGNCITKLLGEDFTVEGNFEDDISILSVGRKLDSIKDDETGKQFKENTKNILEKIFGKDITCDYDIDQTYT